MNTLLALWLPILLSAVVVFIISSLIHMVFKWHMPDYKGFSNEDAVRAAINAGSPTPGQYVLPYCTDMKQAGSPEHLKKCQEGPVGFVRLAASGGHNMGKSLGIWFVFTVVLSAVAAYVAGRICGLDPLQQLRAAKLVFAVSFCSYGFGTVPESIWMARSWTSTAKYLLDAALYAAGTAAVFWFMWPKA
jgi:hypothetical protein